MPKKILSFLLFLALLTNCTTEVSKKTGIGFDPFISYKKDNKRELPQDCELDLNSPAINSYNYMISESGDKLKYCSAPSLVFDEELVFTAIDKSGYSQYYSTSLEEENKNGNSKWEASEINRETLLNTNKNTFYGRGMYTEDFERFYYCECEREKCLISRISYDISSDSWGQAEPISSIANENYLQAISPFVYTNEEEKDILYFSAKKGLEDKFEIYYTESDLEKNFMTSPKLVRMDGLNNFNKITPFYDIEKKELYFSCDKESNYDIYILNEKPRLLGKYSKPDSDEAYYTHFGENKAFYLSDVYIINNEKCVFPNNPGHLIEIERSE